MAEITVSGGVFATLTPIFTLWYGHKEITYDIAPYVTSISYSDSIKNESDVIAIALEDSAGRWVNEWYPRKGDTLALRLGYQGEDRSGFSLKIFIRSEILRRCRPVMSRTAGKDP